jgi:hypothetical protein
MAENYGIKISVAGTDVKDTITEGTVKDFTILSTVANPKVSTQAVLSADSNIAHGLGFVPMYDAYILENTATEAHPTNYYLDTSWRVSADATYLYCDEISGTNKLFYIIYLDQP